MSESVELRQILDGVILRSYKNTSWIRNAYPYIGIILATISSLFFSLCSVIVKGLVDVDPIQLASFRFIGVLLPAIPIAIYKCSSKEEVFPNGKRVILLLRCFTGCCGLMLSFYAFRSMQLADASVIIFSTPVFVAIFAKLFLREPCGIFNVITIVLTLIGVVFITRPPTLFDRPNVSEFGENPPQEYNIHGPIAAICSTLFGANAYVLLRALKELHFSVVLTNFGLFSTIFTLIVVYMMGVFRWPNCGMDRFLIVALAVFSFGGQILLTLALQMEQAGPVSIARSSDIVFAFLWQILFFKEIPNLYSVFGALLVILSVVLSGLRKWAMALPRDSDARKRFRLLTIE